MWAGHILASCMELRLQRVFKSVYCSLRARSAIMLRWRITGKPWGAHWVMLILDRKCSGLLPLDTPGRLCPHRHTLGPCLHQALSVTCITLASTMYDLLKRCFALLIPYNTLTSGKKMFQPGCKMVLCFFWHTLPHRHTLPLWNWRKKIH